MTKRDIDIRYNTEANEWEAAIEENFGGSVWTKVFPAIYFSSDESVKTIEFHIKKFKSEPRPEFKNVPQAITYKDGNTKPGINERTGSLQNPVSSSKRKLRIQAKKSVPPAGITTTYALHFEGSTPDVDPIVQNGGPPPDDMRARSASKTGRKASKKRGGTASNKKTP